MLIEAKPGIAFNYPQNTSSVESSPLVQYDNKSFLPNTGFDDVGETRSFEREMLILLKKGIPWDECLRQSVSNRVENIKAFWHEFLKQSPVLKVDIQIEWVDGERRVVCPNYGNALWVGVVSKEERRGAVSDTVSGVERELLEAKTGDVFIMSSPPGRSGMVRHGEEIIHKKSQTLVCELTPFGLKAVTLVTDMNLDQNHKLLDLPKDFDEEMTLRAPLILENAKVEDVVERVELAMDIRLPQIRQILKNMDYLATKDPEIQFILDEFANLASDIDDLSPRSLNRLQFLISDTILRLWSYKKHGEVDLANYNSPAALQEVQNLEGCSWSPGMKSTGGRRGEKECVYCPICKESVTVLVFADKIQCKKCKNFGPAIAA